LTGANSSEFELPPASQSKSRFKANFLDDHTGLPRRTCKTAKAVDDDEIRTYESDRDGIDVDLDSGNKVVAFNSDYDDDEGMIFDGRDELDARDHEYDSEDKSERNDSEDGVVSDDDEDEEWIDIEL
jgi:hypothetical protein